MNIVSVALSVALLGAQPTHELPTQEELLQLFTLPAKQSDLVKEFKVKGSSHVLRGERCRLELDEPEWVESRCWSVYPSQAADGLELRDNGTRADFVWPIPGRYTFTISVAGRFDQSKADSPILIQHKHWAVNIVDAGSSGSLSPQPMASNATMPGTAMVPSSASVAGDKSVTDVVREWTLKVNRPVEAKHLFNAFQQRAGSIDARMAAPEGSIAAIKKIAAVNSQPAAWDEWFGKCDELINIAKEKKLLMEPEHWSSFLRTIANGIRSTYEGG